MENPSFEKCKRPLAFTNCTVHVFHLISREGFPVSVFSTYTEIPSREMSSQILSPYSCRGFFPVSREGEGDLERLIARGGVSGTMTMGCGSSAMMIGFLAQEPAVGSTTSGGGGAYTS